MIAREILEYLAQHPDASDTAEGIAQWWLLEKEIVNQVGKVQEALADLVKQKLITETRIGDDLVSYSLNR